MRVKYFNAFSVLMTTVGLSVVRGQGNFSFPSADVAKAYCFAFSFLSKAKSIRFSDFINIHRPFRLSPKVRITFRLC